MSKLTDMLDRAEGAPAYCDAILGDLLRDDVIALAGIVEDLANIKDTGADECGDPICILCGGEWSFARVPPSGGVVHAPSCPWLRARALAGEGA